MLTDTVLDTGHQRGENNAQLYRGLNYHSNTLVTEVSSHHYHMSTEAYRLVKRVDSDTLYRLVFRLF